MNGTISLVAKLKEEAKAARDFDDFPAAIAALSRAIEILTRELGGVVTLPESEREARRLEIERELADFYGMKGGLHRREAMGSSGSERDVHLEKAQQMYEHGVHFERGDSYNLTNTIVIPLIRNPERLAELQPKAAKARNIVERQIQGGRATQWWAWADLALLNLLAGDLSRALDAYAQFGRAGAQVRDCQSTINVLQDLQAVWPTGEMRQRLADAIKFLDRQQASVS
jgi:hypothetical protein